MSAARGRLLKVVSPERARGGERRPFDEATLRAADRIVSDVERRGWSAMLKHARRLGDLPARGGRAVFEAGELRAALDGLAREERRALERAATRIGSFASAQRRCVKDLRVAASGFRAGHRWLPVDSAGCYAPGGRFPLPSSVLMTAVTARRAGVPVVWVASPRPAPATLAAAAIAGADALLAVGGAQAVAALAFGAGPVPACACVVGPGNRFVTAAKYLVSRSCAIDMLAGPSEVLVIADDAADARLVAADLLAQAEHDPDAQAVLVSLSPGLVERVEAELAAQLRTLPTAAIARRALRNSVAVVARDAEQAAAIADAMAPEHLEVHTRDAGSLVERLSRYGAAFVGERIAEVVGDYGVGPNHVLPTGGSARSAAGLSVFTFLRARTFIEGGAGAAARGVLRDTVTLARVEGLEGHARAAAMRM